MQGTGKDGDRRAYYYIYALLFGPIEYRSNNIYYACRHIGHIDNIEYFDYYYFNLVIAF